MTRPLAVVSFTLLAVVCSFAQAPVGQRPGDALGAQLRGVSSGDLTVREAAAEVFMSAGVPGGIELVRCGAWIPSVRVAGAATAREALERIAAAKGLSLVESDTAVINLREPILPPQLLEVHIASLEGLTRGGYESLAGQLRSILGTVEVRQALVALGLQEGRTAPGISNLPRDGKLVLTSVVLREVTLRMP